MFYFSLGAIIAMNTLMIYDSKYIGIDFFSDFFAIVGLIASGIGF
jgi:hypothetical protein